MGGSLNRSYTCSVIPLVKTQGIFVSLRVFEVKNLVTIETEYATE